MGSLGFLTPFDYSEYRKTLDAVIQGTLQVRGSCVKMNGECENTRHVSTQTAYIAGESFVYEKKRRALKQTACTADEDFMCVNIRLV